MIDAKLLPRIEERLRKISQFCEGFTEEEKRILAAAVMAMAEAFADLEYDEIPNVKSPHDAPKLLEFFLDGVRHHWAVAMPAKAETWGATHLAIRCPFTDIEIDQLIRRFETAHGLLWRPVARRQEEAA